MTTRAPGASLVGGRIFLGTYRAANLVLGGNNAFIGGDNLFSSSWSAPVALRLSDVWVLGNTFPWSHDVTLNIVGRTAAGSVLWTWSRTLPLAGTVALSKFHETSQTYALPVDGYIQPDILTPAGWSSTTADVLIAVYGESR